MTVKMLIERLQAMPQNNPVVVSRHSEYAEVLDVSLMQGREQGGYVSRVYSVDDKLHAHDYVVIEDL